MSVSGRGVARWFVVPTGWLVLGFLLRLGHLLTLGNQYYFGDTPEYQQIALRILHGSGLHEASPRAPAYPLFLALSFWIGGDGNFFVARALQLLLSVALMLVVVRLARRLGGPAAATLAASIVALSPMLTFVTGLIYPTLIYTLLLMSLTLMAWELAERPGLWRGLGFGALAAMGWLTDMVILAPLLVIGAWLALRLRTGGRALIRSLAAAAVAAVLLVAPYMLRLRAQGGEGVFMGKAQAVLHFARADTMISGQRWIRVPPGTRFEPLSPRAFLAREVGLFTGRPAAYAHDYLMELLHFFKPLPDRVSSQNRYNAPIVLAVGAVHFAALLAFALLGLLHGAGASGGRSLLAVVVVGTAAFYAMFFTQARYRIPIEPHLIVLAALGACSAFPSLARLLSGSPPLGSRRGNGGPDGGT